MLRTAPSLATVPHPRSAPGTPDELGRLSDADLLLRVRAGDDASFAELYRRHLQMANLTARRAGVAPSDTDDVVSEAYAKVLRALRGNRGPTENFPGYLATAVRRVAWSVQETAARYRPTDDLRLLDQSTEPYEPSLLADTAAGAALAALPPDAQILIWRVEIQGHGVGDIARELGKSANSVSAATSRARKRLRAQYAELQV